MKRRRANQNTNTVFKYMQIEYLHDVNLTTDVQFFKKNIFQFQIVGFYFEEKNSLLVFCSHIPVETIDEAHDGYNGEFIGILNMSEENDVLKIL